MNKHQTAWQGVTSVYVLQVCFYISFLLTNCTSAAAAWLPLFALNSWKNCCTDQLFSHFYTSHCRYFCSFLSSPAALLPHFFTAALFTLFKILPLSSPPSISCPFSPFFALTNSLFSIPSPFLSPLEPLFPSSFLQPPYVFLVSLSCSALHTSCCLCWQSGRRRQSEAELAALAPCIIHVPCSLCESRSLLAFQWHIDTQAPWSCVCGAQGLMEGLQRRDSSWFLLPHLNKSLRETDFTSLTNIQVPNEVVSLDKIKSHCSVSHLIYQPDFS